MTDERLAEFEKMVADAAKVSEGWCKPFDHISYMALARDAHELTTEIRRLRNDGDASIDQASNSMREKFEAAQREWQDEQRRMGPNGGG